MTTRAGHADACLSERPEVDHVAIGGGEAEGLRAALAHLRSTTGALAEVAVRAAGDESKRLEIANVLQALPPEGA